MRDLTLFMFIAGLVVLGFKRPFLAVLAYVYIDMLAPQRLAYGFLTKLPLSMLSFLFVFGTWMLIDKKEGLRFSGRQFILLLLLGWCAFTTANADFPVEAKTKWEWVWPTLVFATFLPFTLFTRLRLEALMLFIVLSAGTVVVVGGIKTVLSGGGYGELNLMYSSNTGLGESSTIAAVAIAMIPLITFLMKRSTIFPANDKRVKLFGIALIGACVLIPIGTQARTGLVCAAIVFMLMLRNVKRPFLYIFGALALGLVSVPFLPSAFTERMNTIQGYQGDQSASTRIAVWKWTIDYVAENPAGGGFLSYLQNKIMYETAASASPDGNSQKIVDQGRAFHSAYFEMLGEQGYFGLALWMMLQIVGLWRMEILQRRYRKSSSDQDRWIADFATAMQNAHIVMLIGSLFAGIAFLSFTFFLVCMEIGIETVIRRQGVRATGAIGNPKLAVAG